VVRSIFTKIYLLLKRAGYFLSRLWTGIYSTNVAIIIAILFLSCEEQLFYPGDLMKTFFLPLLLVVFLTGCKKEIDGPNVCPVLNKVYDSTIAAFLLPDILKTDILRPEQPFPLLKEVAASLKNDKKAISKKCAENDGEFGANTLYSLLNLEVENSVSDTIRHDTATLLGNEAANYAKNRAK